MGSEGTPSKGRLVRTIWRLAMRARSEWLVPAELDLIKGEALRILKYTGIRLGAGGTLDDLSRGSPVRQTRMAGVVRLPRALVRDVLARLPRRVLLAGATPADDCLLDGEIHFVPSGAPTMTLDFETGQYRPSTAGGLRRADHRRRRDAGGGHPLVAGQSHRYPGTARRASRTAAPCRPGATSTCRMR